MCVKNPPYKSTTIYYNSVQTNLVYNINISLNFKFSFLGKRKACLRNVIKILIFAGLSLEKAKDV